MKILITGGTGFVGRHPTDYWSESEHRVTVLLRKTSAGFFNKTVGFIKADITVKEAVQAAIAFIEPDVVIHCAAMSKPNDCETDQAQCYLTNVTATQYVVEACKAIGARLVFMSTDFVFGHNGPYAEDAACDPVNYYGESKMLAEQVIRQSGVSFAIVRTVLVVGKKLPGGPGSFLHWVKNQLDAGKPVSVYTDQQRNVTYIADLCKGIDAIITTGFEGIVHLCGSEIFTPYGLAKALADYCGYDATALLMPTTAAERPEVATRPENSVLQITKALKTLHYHPTPMIQVFGQLFS